MFPEIRPMVSVISSDSLNSDVASTLAAVQMLPGAEAWSIDGGHALAIAKGGCNIRQDGSASDPGGFHRASGPLDKALKGRFIEDVLVLTGALPSSRFFPSFVFPKAEEPYRMVAICWMKSPEPLGLRLHTYKDLGDSGFERVKDIFLEWHRDATSAGFHDEVLRCGQPLLARYSKPERIPWPRQFGWEILMSNANEVFFPWLELFFRLRRKLPKSMRVALEFFHPDPFFL